MGLVGSQTGLGPHLLVDHNPGVRAGGEWDHSRSHVLLCSLTRQVWTEASIGGIMKASSSIVGTQLGLLVLERALAGGTPIRGSLF